MLMARIEQSQAKQRLPLLLAIVVVVALVISIVIPATRASADRLLDRTVRIGDATPGATTTHDFKFSYVTTGVPVGSMMFEYCTSPLPEITCDAPQGMNATNAVLEEQIGEGGYFILTGQTNRIILTRAPALPPTVSPSEYKFSGIKNPTDIGTFYVRITTYQSTDGTGAYTDFGSVANTTTQGVNVNGEVPPYLKFCVGITITGDCTSADGNLVDLGTLSPSRSSSGTSQMQAATNAEMGLAIVVYGTTMTSGNNVITSLDNPTPSAPGNSQFGINLRDNTNPNIGQDPSGGGTANPTLRYNTPDRYAFLSGDTVATSPSVTDTRKFTVSYLANITPSQPPGVYTATLTYICTATF
jgi:hypothetical protein